MAMPCPGSSRNMATTSRSSRRRQIRFVQIHIDMSTDKACRHNPIISSSKVPVNHLANLATYNHVDGTVIGMIYLRHGTACWCAMMSAGEGTRWKLENFKTLCNQKELFGRQSFLLVAAAFYEVFRIVSASCKVSHVGGCDSKWAADLSPETKALVYKAVTMPGLHNTSQYFRAFQWGQNGRGPNGWIHNLHNDESWCNIGIHGFFVFPSRCMHTVRPPTHHTFPHSSPHDALQVYHRDFDLLCKEFGYCDPTENVCLTRVPEMCPPQLFEWNADRKIYEPKV